MNTSHPDFPVVSPDFSLMDPDSKDDSGDWMNGCAFAVIEPTKRQGPKWTPTIQSSDHARLHLSARPFCLFSIGLFIYGSGFSVAMFDHKGSMFPSNSTCGRILQPSFVLFVP